MADETTPPQIQDAAPAEEQHVNVWSPDGQLGSLPQSQIQDATGPLGGYRLASDDEVAKFDRSQKYGTLGQQVKTGLEGAASAATFGASTGLEKVLGVNPEDIRARAEENPGSHMVGQGAGLVASSMLLPGGGAAGALTKAGDVAAEAVGLGAAKGAIQKIGSAAVKGAAENAMFQSGDEVAKMLASDNGDFSDTALANIGLASVFGGAIGGGIGAAHPLWDAAVGSKVGKALQSFTNKMGGAEGAAVSPMADVIEKSGMELAPEIKGALIGDPEAQRWASELNQSDTTHHGNKFQESMQQFRSDAGNSMAESLGKKIEDVPDKGDIDKFTTGKNIGNQLAEEYHAQIDPLAKEYEAKRAKFANEELTPDRYVEASPDYSNPYAPKTATANHVPGTVSNIAEDIANKANAENWYKLPDSDIATQVNKVLKALPEQKTLNDLSGLGDAISKQFQSDPLNGPMTRAGGIIKGILRDAEAKVIMERLGAEAPEQIERFRAVRQAYAKQAQIKDAIDSSLHARGSTAGYAKSLREMANTDGETVLRRLSGSGDANILDVLKQNFPKTAELVKDYHINNVLAAAKDGESIKGERLMKALYSQQMSPQLRDFIASPEAMNRIQAISQMLSKFNEIPHNFSNTARTWDKLTQHIPGSAGAAISMIMGHNPVSGAIIGHVSKLLSKDAPDAIKFSLLKFLGSDKPVSAAGFKSAVDMIHNAVKGESAMNSGVKNLFKAGKEVFPDSQMPTENETKKLDKHLKSLQNNPEPLTNVAQNESHYLPNHSAQLAQTAANSANYLNSLRPNTTPANPMDRPLPPSSTAQAAYNSALKIAISPLIVLNKIQKGTLTPADVQHLSTMFPSLHARLADKITSQVADHMSKGDMVPYKTRIALSMFMAQPLDSTMTPNAIVAAQPIPQETQQAPQGKGLGKNKGQSLNKLASGFKTASQAAEGDRADRS